MYIQYGSRSEHTGEYIGDVLPGAENVFTENLKR